MTEHLTDQQLEGIYIVGLNLSTSSRVFEASHGHMIMCLVTELREVRAENARLRQEQADVDAYLAYAADMSAPAESENDEQTGH